MKPNATLNAKPSVLWFTSLIVIGIGTSAFSGEVRPLKVFILAGQSNMQGHAEVRTLKHLGMDLKTAPMLKKLRDDTGEPRTIKHVWISSIGHDGRENERHGELSPDFGASGRGAKVGPEYGFGIYMYEHCQEPILLIKTAWGGKSLHTDFRPPSAPPFEFNEQQLEAIERQGKNLEELKASKREATGRYYRLMIEHVKHVLSDIKRVCPDYDPDAGFELAGFVWFQGWNDMVDGGVYPNRSKPGGYDAYSELLAHFIRDVRTSLEAPQLPFVIGVMGAGGPVDDYGPQRQRYASTHRGFRQAMAAPASLPEFRGNVHAVWTERFWDAKLSELDRRWSQINTVRRSLNRDESLTEEQRQKELDEFVAELYSRDELSYLQTGKSNAEYHYLGSGKVLFQIGRAFADALAKPENEVPAAAVVTAKAVTPITEPPCSYCSTQDLKSFIEPDDRVIAWLRANHNGGAFPIRHFLAGPRVVNDTYGLFFYDPDGGYVSAFRKDYGYQLHGWQQGVMIVKGKDGTLWSALSGKAISGPQVGNRLRRIPSLVTDWKYWLMLHPESTTYDLFDGKKYSTHPLAAEIGSAALESMGKVDPRLKPDTHVLGVEFPWHQRAYELDPLPARACLQDEVEELPIAVFWHGRTKTAVAFDRRVDGKTLTFAVDEIAPETAPFRDEETGTRWSIAGRAIDGPLRGKELTWVNGIQCRWYAWSAEYPKSDVFEAAE